MECCSRIERREESVDEVSLNVRSSRYDGYWERGGRPR